MVLRLLLLSLLLLPSLAMAAGPPRGRVVHTWRAGPPVRLDPARFDSVGIAGLDSTALRELVFRTRGELVNRDRDRRVRPWFADRDSTDVREQFGIRLDPQLRRAGDRTLRRILREGIRVYRDVRHMETGSRLSRVPAMVAGPGSEPGSGLRFATSTPVIEAGQSVAALVHMRDIANFDGTWQLFSERTLADFRIDNVGPCEFVELQDAPIVDVEGTAFLVDSLKIVTASHVADTSSLMSDYYVVFGYAWNEDGTARTTFSDDDVYRIVGKVYWSNSWGRDVAVLELDRKVKGRTPIGTGWPDAPLAGSDLVYAMGHPYGLPLVVTESGGLLDNEPCSFFTSDIEISLFNSGSPVFNASTDKVAGVVSSNFANARTYCSCWAGAIYLPSDGRAGVTATRIGVVQEYLANSTSARVFSQFPAATALAGVTLTAMIEGSPPIAIATSDTPSVLPAGKEVELWFGEDCVARFTPSAGETWYVQARPGTAIAEVLRCPQDGMTY